ncbi:unnamed protein product [Strongylus vulgaris]|uniref:Uncharacterized protein n=1 Tax=Strongylus vulgaris TaxID=40348 RepID=A0A3P7I219_STRVU|nr:unnamed protein product [Strongylus vulgaris]
MKSVGQIGLEKFPQELHATSNGLQDLSVQQWSLKETRKEHPPLVRTRSKSFTQTADYYDSVGYRCSCEVCKQRTITNKMYFPRAMLQARGIKTVPKGAYDEVEKPTTSTISVGSVNNRVSVQKHKEATAPDPPPRGIFRNGSDSTQQLDFSKIKTWSCNNLDYLETTSCIKDDESNNELMPPEEGDSDSEDSGLSVRVSITSITDEDEAAVTRL